MDFKEYQTAARETAIYPEEYKVIYTALGLTGEAGEVAEKIKKVIRDKGGKFSEEDKTEITKELGDVMWYVANIAADLDIDLSLVASVNIDKLKSRRARAALQGSGDNR
jgi:NTP pyrophosphatase (non-canonical NTP hydrolase)